jgi:DNA-binding LacI/PurR family transcriptional regulator
MNDVAAAAGVAQSTVSRILNDAPVSIRVSPETRQRVRAIADELGYRPHPIARALRGAPTMLLGAIVRDITDPFFAAAIEALSIEAKERGYSVVLGHARTKADEALALTAVLEARHCDAIILLGDIQGERRLIEDLRRTNIRVVALWHGWSGRADPFPTIGVDNRAGIREALDHLVACGHSRIAYVGAAFGDMRERLAAYREYMTESIGAPPRGAVRLVPNTVGGGEAALIELMRQSRAPTAIVAATDILAIGVIHAAFERGIRVPEQLSVVGFDDITLASATVPALTTVRNPVAEVIAAAVELAVGEASATAADTPRRIFSPKLVVRGSTAAPPPDDGALRRATSRRPRSAGASTGSSGA